MKEWRKLLALLLGIIFIAQPCTVQARALNGGGGGVNTGTVVTKALGNNPKKTWKPGLTGTESREQLEHYMDDLAHANLTAWERNNAKKIINNALNNLTPETSYNVTPDTPGSVEEEPVEGIAEYVDWGWRIGFDQCLRDCPSGLSVQDMYLWLDDYNVDRSNWITSNQWYYYIPGVDDQAYPLGDLTEAQDIRTASGGLDFPGKDLNTDPCRILADMLRSARNGNFDLNYWEFAGDRYQVKNKWVPYVMSALGALGDNSGLYDAWLKSMTDQTGGSFKPVVATMEPIVCFKISTPGNVRVWNNHPYLYCYLSASQYVQFLQGVSPAELNTKSYSELLGTPGAHKSKPNVWEGFAHQGYTWGVDAYSSLFPYSYAWPLFDCVFTDENNVPYTDGPHHKGNIKEGGNVQAAWPVADEVIRTAKAGYYPVCCPWNPVVPLSGSYTWHINAEDIPRTNMGYREDGRAVLDGVTYISKQIDVVDFDMRQDTYSPCNKFDTSAVMSYNYKCKGATDRRLAKFRVTKEQP